MTSINTARYSLTNTAGFISSELVAGALDLLETMYSEIEIGCSWTLVHGSDECTGRTVNDLLESLAWCAGNATVTVHVH